MTTTITASSLPFPSPQKAHKPNPHPYAIKTTSTSLLSRSNTSPHNSQTARYHYVPPSPNPSPTKSGRGNRYSGSLSDEMPGPLPIPPGFTRKDAERMHSALAESDLPSPRRLKRAETLPVSSGNPMSVAPSLEDLPLNPKSWTPAQLSSYLTTALRVRSGETLSLPSRVAEDIAKFARDKRMTGKIFLRATDNDLREFVLFAIAVYKADVANFQDGNEPLVAQGTPVRLIQSPSECSPRSNLEF